MKILLYSVATGIVLFILGDFIYAWIVGVRQKKWESAVERSDDGVRVGCESFTTGTGGTALLMVHGFSDSPAVFSLMAQNLAERDYTCRVVRLPGFCEPFEVLEQTNREDWHRTLDEEIARLRASFDTVWIVGHSTGAALSVRYTLDHPAAADGLILLAPLVEVSGRRSPVLSPHLWFKVTDSVFIFTDRLETCFDLDVRSEEGQQALIQDKYMPMAIIKQTFAVANEIKDRAPDVKLPVYIAVSDDDSIVDSDAAVAWAQQLGSSRTKLVHSDVAGHVLPVDVGWRDLCADIDVFIRETDSQPSSGMAE